MSPACNQTHNKHGQARFLATWFFCLWAATPVAAQQASNFAIINARVFDGFVVLDSAS
jgi:hypothetical protein